MPLTTIEYRLRVRTQADDGDLLILSSRSTDPNCLLTEGPSGDGQRVDIFEGRTEIGAYTWLAVDRDDGGDTRTITALLSDVDARNQMLSNKCVGEKSIDSGAWTAFHTGYLNEIRLPDALTYEFTIGDTDRREQQAELFRTTTPAFDRACCIIGGPVVANPPVAHGGTPTRAWGPVIDYGPARFQVISNPSGLVNPTNRITLTLVSGRFPPIYGGLQTSFAITFIGFKVAISAEEIDRLARPYFEWDGDGRYATDGSQDAQPWGSFPGLVVKMKAVSGGAITYSFPIAQETKKASETIPGYPGGAPDYAIGDYSALVANSNNRLIVVWDTTTMGSAPSNGTQFDVLIYPSAISEKNPLHLSGHPIDLHTAANTQEGIPYDSTSATATKTALGDLFYELRIKGPMKYADFTKMLKGSAGYATRYGANGQQEFFATRALPTTSVSTVTASEIVTDEGA